MTKTSNRPTSKHITLIVHDNLHYIAVKL